MFSSPNSPVLPTIPPFRNFSDQYEPEPEEVQDLCWAMNRFPQLGFLPASPHFHGPIFQRLNHVNIAPVNNKWQLDPQLQKSWATLEDTLKFVGDALLSDLCIPLNFSYFPLPATFGYRRQHRSHRAALRCAEHSRNAFFTLAASCSYGMAMRRSDSTSSTPRWVGILLERGVFPEWIDDFRKSQFADFLHTQRVGVIMHPACDWLQLIPMLVRTNVPVWIEWSDGRSDYYGQKSTYVARYRPQPGDISMARALEQQSPNLLHTPVMSPASVVGLCPEPDPTSRQRRGETFEQFFEREKADHDMRASLETLSAKQVRLSRERSAIAAPGRRGPRVYEWEDVDGFLMRLLVPRGDVENIWECYKESQRRFNSFENQWDLAAAFDPSTSTIDPYAYSDDSDEEHSPRPASPLFLPPPNSLPLPLLSRPAIDASREDFATTHGNADDPNHNHNHALPTSIPEPDRLDDILYYRYGFNKSSSYQDVRFFSQDNLTRVKRTLGDGLANLESSIHADVIAFVQRFVCGQPPALLWDLSPTHEFPLADTLTTCNVIVLIKQLRDKTYYTIEPRISSSNDAPWRLVVEDPVTVIECLRRAADWGRSRYRIAQSFLDRGIPFSTREPVPIVPSPRPYFIGLCPRPPGYEDGLLDYFAYEERLTVFLQMPHARAALLQGGIVWRLAKLVLDERRDSDALRGPSSDVDIYGKALSLNPSGARFWDDVLSTEELDLICGVHQIYTGMFLSYHLKAPSNLCHSCQSSVFRCILVAKTFGLGGQRLQRRLLVSYLRGLVPKTPPIHSFWSGVHAKFFKVERRHEGVQAYKRILSCKQGCCGSFLE
jgi:hypothetical protein